MRRHVDRAMLSAYLSALREKAGAPPDHPNAKLQVVEDVIDDDRLTAIFSPDPAALILAMREVAKSRALDKPGRARGPFPRRSGRGQARQRARRADVRNAMPANSFVTEGEANELRDCSKRPASVGKSLANLIGLAPSPFSPCGPSTATYC